MFPTAWQDIYKAPTTDVGGVVGFLIQLVVTALFIHFAARIVIDRGGFLQAILVALLASLLAGAVLHWVGGTAGLLLAIVVWALVAAIIYRTQWLKAAVVGLVAVVLAIIVQWVLSALL